MGGVPRKSDYESRLRRAEMNIATLQKQPSFLTLQSLIDAEAELREEQIAALPIIDSETDETSGWQATNGGTVASVSFTWPSNKDTVTIMAQMSGFYQADAGTPLSDRPAFHIRIGGTDSPVQPRVPDNMDTYHLVGAFNRKYTGSGTATVQVRTQTGPTLSPAVPANRMYLGAIAVFTDSTL